MQATPIKMDCSTLHNTAEQRKNEYSDCKTARTVVFSCRKNAENTIQQSPPAPLSACPLRAGGVVGPNEPPNSLELLVGRAPARPSSRQAMSNAQRVVHTDRMVAIVYRLNTSPWQLPTRQSYTKKRIMLYDTVKRKRTAIPTRSVTFPLAGYVRAPARYLHAIRTTANAQTV